MSHIVGTISILKQAYTENSIMKATKTQQLTIDTNNTIRNTMSLPNATMILEDRSGDLLVKCTAGDVWAQVIIGKRGAVAYENSNYGR